MYDFIKDPTLYNLVRGPLVWIAFIVFIGGSIYRVNSFIDMVKKDKTIMPFISLKYTLRSLFHWLIPFNSSKLEKTARNDHRNIPFPYRSRFYTLYFFSHTTSSGANPGE